MKRWVLLLALLGCHPTPPPVPPGPPDAGADHVYTCADVCARGEALHCTWAAPTLAGASCAQVCENAQSGPIAWDLKCKATAADCGAADACPAQ